MKQETTKEQEMTEQANEVQDVMEVLSQDAARVVKFFARNSKISNEEAIAQLLDHYIEMLDAEQDKA